MARLGRARPAGTYLFLGRTAPDQGGVAHTATAALTVTPSFSAARTRGKYRTAALTVAPSFSPARVRGKYRTAALTVSPSFSGARLHGHGRTAALLAVPSFSAARTAGHVRAGALAVHPSFSVAASGGAAPAAPPVGSWWGLHSVFEQQRSEFEAFISSPPLACPTCGEPLRYAPSTGGASGIERYCPYDGWRYPQDYIPPSRPWPGTV